MKAETIAPFAEWPKQFDVYGRCDRCDEFASCAFLVTPANNECGCRVHYSHAFCEECMILMGVGQGLT